ncbi:hypothetical protein [Oceanirhabdus sp. W0125-5]|uniref:hypothetical protein n=1 Tax=Oceanirhabdus sp. W0125-5 TaxID=2999116 RepID=UPI0022F32A1C|nr:hypothetical protein [Oceanirhabdus sp. W0125-5]WBW99051.1 hypothetical protein OW730_09980 [Oceanirhabdus sp. W0125-5]
MIKRLVSIILIVCHIVILSSGCGSKKPQESGKNSKKVEEVFEEPIKKMVTPDKLIAAKDEISIEFSGYDIDKEEEVVIQEVQPKPFQIEEELKEELMITAYDFEVVNKSEFIDLIEISIPYDENFIEEGKEENCVSAMYYNENSKEWQPVVYTVDTENNLVKIITDHLSTYGAFVVKRENSRAAKIVKLNTWHMPESNGNAFKIVNECLENQMTPGEKALEMGTSWVGDWLGISGGMHTVITNTVYTTEFLDNLGGAMTNIGLAAAIAQAAVDFQKGDDVALKGNLTKNLSYFSIGKWGSGALQLSFVGVYAIDYSINKFGTAAWEGRKADYEAGYKLYYEKYNKRSAKEWYKKFYWIWQDNKDAKDPNLVSRLINEEIDNYCNAFWKIDYEEMWAIMEEVNTKANEITQQIKDEISLEYKKELIKVLQKPVFDRLEQKITEHLKKEYLKEKSALARMLNQVVTFEYKEDIKENEKSKYNGYTVRFAPLNEKADPKNWTGKVNEQGMVKAKFTVLGHMQCGSPNTLEFYKPGDKPDIDKPEKVVEFKLDIPKTTITEKESKEQEGFNNFYLFSGEKIPKDKIGYAPYFLLNELRIEAPDEGFGFIQYQSGTYEFRELHSIYGEQEVVIDYFNLDAELYLTDDGENEELLWYEGEGNFEYKYTITYKKHEVEDIIELVDAPEWHVGSDKVPKVVGQRNLTISVTEVHTVEGPLQIMRSYDDINGKPAVEFFFDGKKNIEITTVTTSDDPEYQKKTEVKNIDDEDLYYGMSVFTIIELEE